MTKQRIALVLIIAMLLAAHYPIKQRFASGLTKTYGVIHNTLIPFLVVVDIPEVNPEHDPFSLNRRDVFYRETYVGLCGCYFLMSGYRHENEAVFVNAVDRPKIGLQPIETSMILAK